MTTRVDGHSWALSAIDEHKVQKIITPLNKDLIPITDSPVVVQQHMLPPKKFVLLSAQVCGTIVCIQCASSVNKKKNTQKLQAMFLKALKLCSERNCVCYIRIIFSLL